MEEWTRRIEVNNDEYSLFMALGIGYCLLRIISGTKGLNPFLGLHEASEVEVLNKYVMGWWSDNFTATFFVSFAVTIFVLISRDWE